VKNKNHAKLSYQKYLKEPYWLKLREAVLKRDNYTCTSCGSKKNLHMHHGKYRGYYKEKLKDLITLCSFCHRYYEHSILGKFLKVGYPILYIVVSISIVYLILNSA